VPCVLPRAGSPVARSRFISCCTRIETARRYTGTPAINTAEAAVTRGSRRPFPGGGGTRGSLQLISPGWVSAGGGGGTSVTGNSRRERVITSVMSKSIVFGKWDATPKCVFEAKVMSRDDALMTTSPEKIGFKSTFPQATSRSLHPPSHSSSHRQSPFLSNA